MKIKKDKSTSSLKATVTDKLQLPKDLLLGAVILSITGQNEAYVENYKGIIEYTDNVIKLQTKTCKLMITGSNLKIEYFTNDEMRIKGRFEEIKYYQ